MQEDGETYKIKIKDPCPICGREHLTALKLRHASDSVFASLSDFYSFVRHIDWRRCWFCKNSGAHPPLDPHPQEDVHFKPIDLNKSYQNWRDRVKTQPGTDALAA